MLERPTTRRKAYGSLDESREPRQGPTREMRIREAQNAEIAEAQGRLLLQLLFLNDLS